MSAVSKSAPVRVVIGAAEARVRAAFLGHARAFMILNEAVEKLEPSSRREDVRAILGVVADHIDALAGLVASEGRPS